MPPVSIIGLAPPSSSSHALSNMEEQGIHVRDRMMQVKEGLTYSYGKGTQFKRNVDGFVS